MKACATEARGHGGSAAPRSTDAGAEGEVRLSTEFSIL
jgi:hypothetical protein